MSGDPTSEARIISMADERAARSDAEAGARPRCRATTADGRPCRNYAVEDGRCRVHAVRSSAGGRSAGRPGTADDPSPGGAPFSAAGEEDVASARARIAGEARRRGWRPPVDVVRTLLDTVGDEWVDGLRDVAGFLRRRLTGDYEVDVFGFDEDVTTHVLFPLLRPLHRHYWRVASHGAEHVPRAGGALLVSNHAGTLPADALITRLDLYEGTGRHIRELGADLVFRLPFVGEIGRKTGVTLASNDDADRLLAAGELVAVWPEGFKGVGKRWKDRYRLQRFGRGGFVATALRAEVPIIPTAIVGSEEIYPMVYDLRLLARMLGLPYFPVVAQSLALPVLGPLALLPLPSKWIIEYGEPLDTGAYGREAAEDPMAVFDLADQVRDTIQDMVHRNLMGRRSVFL